MVGKYIRVGVDRQEVLSNRGKSIPPGLDGALSGGVRVDSSSIPLAISIVNAAEDAEISDWFVGDTWDGDSFSRAYARSMGWKGEIPPYTLEKS